MVFVALLGFIWNKAPFPRIMCFNIADNAKWTSLIVVSLQFWDFVNDINLCIEIWASEDVIADMSLLIIAIGSSVFVIIRYIANPMIAAKI